MAKPSTARPLYVCPVCGDHFTWAPKPGRAGRPPVTCGDECRSTRSKQKARDRYAEALAAQRRRRSRGSPYLAVSCDVQGCARLAYAKNMCDLHYNRLRTTGEVGPPGPKKRPIGSTWTDPRTGYVYVKPRGGRRRLQHRLVLEQVLGRPLERWENVHHVNGVRADNRPENLELWVKPQPAGQRADQLADWVVEHYPELVESALAKRTQLRLAI